MHYENYIRFVALSERKFGQSVTHVCIDKEKNQLLGYVSIRVTSLISKDANGTLVVHPSLEISELAVSDSCERMGIGTMLVDVALAISDEIRNNFAGIRYVVVCADPQAVGFYKKLGFGEIRELFETPRDGFNDNCTPMYIQLPELEN